MTGQPWLAAAFAGIMIITAAYCLTRLRLSWRRRRPTDRPVDAVHVLMGVAMAGMLVPGLRVLWAGGWEIVFGVSGIVFLWRMARSFAARRRAGPAPLRAHDGQHLLGCSAMLYMLTATVPASAAGRDLAAGAMSGRTGLPVLALILAMALLGCVVWTADKITAMAPVAALAGMGTVADAGTFAGTVAGTGTVAGAAGPRLDARPTSHRRAVPLSPRLAACCEIAMGVTMGYMLIVLL